MGYELIYQDINNLVAYAILEDFIDIRDRTYAINRLLFLLHLDTFKEPSNEAVIKPISELLIPLNEYAIAHQLIEDTPLKRDHFDSEVMGIFLPPPSVMQDAFYKWYQISPEHATSKYYHQAIASNYIRMDRIKRNLCYKIDCEYGTLDITINLSKPEKDPVDIARQKNSVMEYPRCLLCKENEGYHGNTHVDGRSNHRLITIQLQKHTWYLQYSPYVYYNEHCIILNECHKPMQISKETFLNMLDFVTQFPHYFIGSNADLPIVGGSILSHDHYQGGRNHFAMEDATSIKSYSVFEDFGVSLDHLHWPLTVLRLKSASIDNLVMCANKVLTLWRTYSDEAMDIQAYSGEEPHNTITPIARRRGHDYELDLVLRNNRTSSKHPLGIFHPHEEIHHIKKENIGLIEVMGLAVLPARLLNELKALEAYLLNPSEGFPPELKHHELWIQNLQSQYAFTSENVTDILNQEVGKVFVEGLKHCAVYPHHPQGDQYFDLFIQQLAD